jgi:hypothetical protein
MAEYHNDFAQDEAWKDQDITVPLRSVLQHHETIATLNGIIDQLRDENGSLRHQLTCERNEAARLRGEVGELTAIIDRLTAKVGGGEHGTGSASDGQ